MVNPKVSDWVRKTYNAGFSRDAIAEKLLERGLRLNDVEDILNKSLPNEGSGNKKAFRLIIFLVVFVVAVSASAAGFFIWKGLKLSPDHVKKVINREIVPNVVLIECLDETEQVAGSGTGFYTGGENHRVETNAHVVIADDGKFYGCWVYFPNADGSFYESSYWAGEIYSFNDMESLVNGQKVNGIDYAHLLLTEPGTNDEGLPFPFPPEKEGIFHPIEKLCRERNIELADRIFVIGYPGIGSNSITISEGIISGFLGDFSEWIKVSANINPGNSGGVAIGMDDGCMYGIPTQLQYDETGSIGQLLSYWFVSSFLDGVTGNKTRYDITLDESEFLEYWDANLGIRIRYPPELKVENLLFYEGVMFTLPDKDAVKQGYDSFTITSEILPPEISDVGSYADISIQNLESTYIEMVLLSREKIYAGGEEAVKIVYTLPAGKTFYITQILIVHNGVAYVLTSSAEEGDFEQVSTIFEKVVGTFEFTPSTASKTDTESFYGFFIAQPGGWEINENTAGILQFDSPAISGKSASIIIGILDRDISSFDDEAEVSRFTDMLNQGVTDFVLLDNRPLTINGKKAYSFTFSNTILGGENKSAQQVYIKRNDDQVFLVAYVSDSGQFETYHDTFTDTLNSFSSS